MEFKNIDIGNLIESRVKELGIESERICRFFNCSGEKIGEMYRSKSLDTEYLLKWSKLLKYDFFRIYTQVLILYAPPSSVNGKKEMAKESGHLPQFRKNIYTKEIIDFILNAIATGEKTKKQIIAEYRIPKTTLYKWINKYKI